MRKCRTTSYVTYWIGSWDGKGRVYIDVYPQQRWEYHTMLDRDGSLPDKVTLSRKNITLEIPRKDFDKHWRFIDEEV